MDKSIAKIIKAGTVEMLVVDIPKKFRLAYQALSACGYPVSYDSLMERLCWLMPGNPPSSWRDFPCFLTDVDVDTWRVVLPGNIEAIEFTSAKKALLAYGRLFNREIVTYLKER